MLWIPLMVRHQLAETLCLCTEPLAKSQRGDLNPPSSPDYCSRWLYHLSYAGMFAVELQRVIQPHDKRDFFSILVRVDSRPARGTAFCFPLHLPSGWVLDASLSTCDTLAYKTHVSSLPVVPSFALAPKRTHQQRFVSDILSLRLNLLIVCPPAVVVAGLSCAATVSGTT